MAVSINGEVTPVNWAEVVSSELRAWWEVVNTSTLPARNPDPVYQMPPPLVSLIPQTTATLIPTTGGLAIDRNTLLLLAIAVAAIVLINHK